MAGFEVIIEDHRPKGWQIELVEAPYASKPNLQAQRGLFSLFTTKDLNAGEPPNIEQYVESFRDAPGREMGPWLRKLTLPSLQAGALLRLLDQHGVNVATIFPGYDGVVKSIEEREFFA